jgi:hypothetical protein
MNDNIEQQPQQTVEIKPNYESLAQTFMQESQIQRERADAAELRLKALDSQLDGLRTIIRAIVAEELSSNNSIIDYEDLAQYINYRELGYELDYSDLAYHLDESRVAEEISLDSLADTLSNRIEITFKG